MGVAGFRSEGQGGQDMQWGSCVEVIGCGLVVVFEHIGWLGGFRHMKCKYGDICSAAACCIFLH